MLTARTQSYLQLTSRKGLPFCYTANETFVHAYIAGSTAELGHASHEQCC